MSSKEQISHVHIWNIRENSFGCIKQEGNEEAASEANVQQDIYDPPHVIIPALYSEPPATCTGNFKWVLCVTGN